VPSPTETPADTPTQVPTSTPTATDIPTAATSATPVASETPTTTPTFTGTPVPGDLDEDLAADAAFVSPSGLAEIVVNLATAPTKVTVPGATMLAWIGRPVGAAKSYLITATKSESGVAWKKTDFMTGEGEIFGNTKKTGVPLPGCYASNNFVPATFVRGKKLSTVIMSVDGSDKTVKLPAGAVSAKCGEPVAGQSAIFSLVVNPGKNTANVVGWWGSSTVLTSTKIDSKLKGLVLGTVPRADGLQPTVFVLGRLGRSQVLAVYSQAKTWVPLAVPDIPKGSTVSAASAVRLGSASFMVIQLTDRARDTSYRAITIPEELL